MQKILLSPKDSSEVINQIFDFSSLVANGVTIISAATTSVVYRGVDPSPSSMIYFLNTISGYQVTQRISGGLDGVTYLITCQATLSDSSLVSLFGYLAVIGALS